MIDTLFGPIKEKHERTEAEIFGKTIVIVIEDGALSEVLNVPEGYTYHLRDLDGKQGIVVDEDNTWKCPACDHRNTLSAQDQEEFDDGMPLECANCDLEYEVDQEAES
jgi:hypothetical protein